MRLVLLLFIFIVGSESYADECGAKITRYYRNAELKQFPATPLEPISRSDAENLDRQGDAYFVHVICESGDPLTLMKRWNQKMYFIIKYLYQDGKLIGQKSLNANGETNEYYIE